MGDGGVKSGGGCWWRRGRGCEGRTLAAGSNGSFGGGEGWPAGCSRGTGATSGRPGLTVSSASSSSSWRTGFDSFGSLPSLMARRMRAAFHLAYLIFFCVSSSGVSQMLISWKNVAAASNVSAVCLDRIPCQRKRGNRQVERTSHTS